MSLSKIILSSPYLMGAFFVTTTTISVLGYRQVYSPWQKRRKAALAEEYAQFIFEKEFEE